MHSSSCGHCHADKLADRKPAAKALFNTLQAQRKLGMRVRSLQELLVLVLVCADKGSPVCRHNAGAQDMQEASLMLLPALHAAAGQQDQQDAPLQRSILPAAALLHMQLAQTWTGL